MQPTWIRLSPETKDIAERAARVLSERAGGPGRVSQSDVLRDAIERGLPELLRALGIDPEIVVAQ